MTADTPSVSLTPTKVLLHGWLTYGLDARDIHRALLVTKKFPVWIVDHIASGNFLENQDFIVRHRATTSSFAEGHLDYFISLDMAQALAIMEPKSAEKTALRRSLLELARGTLGAKLTSYRPTFDREFDELVMAHITDVVGKRLPALLADFVTDRRIQVRYGKTAGQVWLDKGFPPLRGIYSWFGNRLKQAGCVVSGSGYGELGNTRARLFDPDKVNQWLAAGGKRIVEQKILEVLGQGSFDFSGAPTSQASTPPPPATRVGCDARRSRR